MAVAASRPDEVSMRRSQVALITTFTLAALVVAFAAHQSSVIARRAPESTPEAAVKMAAIIAADKNPPRRPAQTHGQYQLVRAYRLAKAHGLRLERPTRERLSAQVRPTSGQAYDSAPSAPGPAPTVDIPTPLDIPTVDVPDVPDVCQTDPPESLDACSRRPTAGSMLACIKYYVSCYG
jgi:hypothetical protein